jgi:undecaprenyl-diphosphatase
MTPRRRDPALWWVLGLTAAVGGVLAVGLTALSAEIYDAVLERDGLAVLDEPVLDIVVSMRSPWLEEAVTRFTDLGAPVGMTILTSVAVLAMTILWRSWTPLVLMAVAVAGSLAMTGVGKAVTARARPAHDFAVAPFETSASFPSGHALNSMVIAGVVAYLLIRRYRSAPARVLILAFTAWFAVAMGLSRVYLGHHWLTDVLVAWTLGLAWLTVVITLHRLYLAYRRAG